MGRTGQPWIKPGGVENLKGRKLPFRSLDLLIKVIIKPLCLSGRSLGWPASFPNTSPSAIDSNPGCHHPGGQSWVKSALITNRTVSTLDTCHIHQQLLNMNFQDEMCLKCSSSSPRLLCPPHRLWREGQDELCMLGATSEHVPSYMDFRSTVVLIGVHGSVSETTPV